MKKGLLFSLMLVFILALCLTVTSCPEPSNAIPAELVGKWGPSVGDIELFEIISNGTLVIAGPPSVTYNISVSGDTVTLKHSSYGNADAGYFKYSIENSLMTVTEGDLTGLLMVAASPLKKL